MNATATSEDKILRGPAVQTMTGLSRSTIWRLEQDGAFPMRIKLGLRACGWRLSDVQEWIASRGEATQKQQI